MLTECTHVSQSTPQVQWLGTIAPSSASKDLFIFYDFLPTAAELAGVPRSAWPKSDGVSAVPIFKASVAHVVGKLAPASPNRVLYLFCALGAVRFFALN
jgi:arylsulfatase A-like enzyme